MDLSIEELIITMAEYHHIDISEPMVRMYAKDYHDSGHTVAEISAAWHTYRVDLKNDRFPKPGALFQIISPRETDRGISDRLASRLISAASRHGIYWTHEAEFHTQFIDELGDLAWVLVQNRGGWTRFCEQTHGPGNLDTFRAQLRDEIVATLASARAGTVYERPSLPSSGQGAVMEIVGRLAGKKSLPGSKKPELE